MIAKETLRTKLEGYPEDILQDYAAYYNNREPERLNAFVIGLIQFLQDAGASVDSPEPEDSMKLREDLGIDSITIAEVVFLLEEILEIEIDNQDLMEIETVGQLKGYILQKVA